MKRAFRFLNALIVFTVLLTFGASASEAPMGTLLPDNVTGFGTTMTGDARDDLLPTGDVTDNTLPVPSSAVTDATAPLTADPSSLTMPSATDTDSASSGTQPSGQADTDYENYALSSNGATYSIVRLSADKASEEEIAEYFGGTDDSGKRLNDGRYGDVESASLSVAVGGSGRTFRYKFDLGAVKNGITRIVFKNIQDSYSADPLNNRSFDDAKFAVSAGDSENSVSPVKFTLRKEQLGDNGFSYDVTLELDNEASGRYVYLEAGPVENAFVLSLDEIQIFGRASAVSAPSESETSGTELKTPATGDSNTSGYAFIALVSSVIIAAVVLYRRKKTV